MLSVVLMLACHHDGGDPEGENGAFPSCWTNHAY